MLIVASECTGGANETSIHYRCNLNAGGPLGAIIPGHTYEVRVRAHANGPGFSDYSQLRSIRVPAYGPPTGLSAVWLSGNVVLSWNGVETASGYEVHRATEMYGSYSFLGMAASPSFEDTDVAPGGSYFYKVRAHSYQFQPTDFSIVFWPSSGSGYSVSGTVLSSGMGLAGVTMALTGGAQTTTALDGTYTFSNVPEGTYTVTPARAGYLFTPVQQSVTVSGSSVTGADFTGTAPAPSYICGRVTTNGEGLGGVTVQISGGSQTTTASDGTYLFSGLASGVYVVTPSLAGYTFSPEALGYDLNNSGTLEANFTANGALNLSISGMVTEDYAGLSGVTMTLSGDGTQTTTTASGGTFTFGSVPAGTHTVTPSLTGHTFSPTSWSGTVSSLSVTGVDFTAVAAYSISGTVTKDAAGLSGVTMTLSGDGTQTATTASGGTYTFSGLAPGSYVITPSLASHTFTPSSQSVSVSSSNRTGIDFIAAATSFTISGTVTQDALGVGSVTMTLSGSGSQTTTTASNGTYALSSLVAGTYTVTPSLAGHTFSPTSWSGTVSGSDVTGVDFAATAGIGNTWSDLGTVIADPLGAAGYGFPGHSVRLVDADGTPVAGYIRYGDFDGIPQYAGAMRLASSSWEAVGANLDGTIPSTLPDSYLESQLSLAAGGSTVYLETTDNTTTFIHREDTGAWSSNLADASFTPWQIEIACLSGTLYAAQVTSAHQVLVQKWTGSAWEGVGGTDGIITTSGLAWDLAFKNLGGALYVAYAEDLDDNGFSEQLTIAHWDGSSWQTDLEWTQDYLMGISIVQVGSDLYCYVGSASMSDFLGGVYKATGSSTVEMIDDSRLVYGVEGLAANANGLFILGAVYDTEASQLIPQIYLWDGTSLTEVVGTYAGKTAKGEILAIGNDIFHVYGDSATLTAWGDPTELRASKLSP